MHEKLIARIEERHEYRDRAKRDEENYLSHIKVMETAADMTDMEFWCKRCHRDFKGTGYKRVGKVSAWPMAWYSGRCACGKEAIRRITNKLGDEYYRLSKNVRVQQAYNANDLLTPDDPLFPLIYPRQYQELCNQRK